MRSDNKALSAVQDALGLGAGKVDTAYTAITDIKDQVDSIKAKLARGTFAATFLVATLAALEMEGLRLADL